MPDADGVHGGPHAPDLRNARRLTCVPKRLEQVLTGLGILKGDLTEDVAKGGKTCTAPPTSCMSNVRSA